jgi:hypothetical protein
VLGLPGQALGVLEQELAEPGGLPSSCPVDIGRLITILPSERKGVVPCGIAGTEVVGPPPAVQSR